MAAGSQGLRNLLFLGVSALAMGLIVFFYRSTPKTHPALASALAMIFGGAVGNLIDRLRFGEVVDFLDLFPGGLSLAGLQCGRQRHYHRNNDFHRPRGTGKNARLAISYANHRLPCLVRSSGPCHRSRLAAGHPDLW
jgi:hypothetical protein